MSAEKRELGEIWQDEKSGWWKLQGPKMPLSFFNKIGAESYKKMFWETFDPVERAKHEAIMANARKKI